MDWRWRWVNHHHRIIVFFPFVYRVFSENVILRVINEFGKCQTVIIHFIIFIFCNFFWRFRQTNMSLLTENRNCQTAFEIRSLPRLDFEHENCNFNQTADTTDWKKKQTCRFLENENVKKRGKLLRNTIHCK